MKKRGNLLAIMLATSMVFAGCANDQANDADNNESTVEESTETQTPENEADTDEDNKDSDSTDESSDEDEEEEEDDSASEDSDEEGNLVLHRAYPAESGKSFATIVVATSGDKIVDAFIDEYQFFDKESDYEGVPNSDKEFGEGNKEDMILASKMDNEEAYSQEMKDAGGEATLLDNYNAVIDYAKGKTISELEDFLEENDDDQILDAVSGATFKSTPSLLQYVVDTAKDDDFAVSGDAENPDDITLKYALGAPHGEKSFGNAVVALEGDKIIAASIDEYQYLEDADTNLDEESDFAKNYADSNVVLASKLENDESYSDLMKEKAEATKTIKENYEAIENFVAGKTIDEVKEVISDNEGDDSVEAVSGATLVDTVGYLQLIVDAAESDK
ncbi:peptidoglycan-binding protein [uncultured Anaerococcus sp.]|uniref:peptidoglycan-binding protein n=1 Tax=uncultured Anaerococcus sp. TaxID=293428 RepID=UPI00262D5DE8|nr:peptidoglycan-binding protein [uncultured Anaerococcus sp.]